MSNIAKNYHYFWKWVFIRETNIYKDKTKTKRRIEKRQCKCGRKFKNGQSLDGHKKQCGVRK